MSQPRPMEPQEILAALRSSPARWMTPTIALTALALFYAVFLHQPLWEARQSLLIRDEAASDLSSHGRPGRFDGLDAMKTAQETVIELARSRAVVAAALKQIGPPANHRKPQLWPTPKDVEQAQERLQVKAPRGAEFGKTEVFCILVEHSDRERALALNRALADQLQERLQLVRDRRAQGLVEELHRTVELSRSDLEAATGRLSQIERQVGGDLAELRLLSDSVGGESNLRMAAIAVKNDLRAARVQRKNHQQLLEMLSAAQRDPSHLLAAPSHLLASQPALQRLKEGLVDAQLASARLQGNMTASHPLVLSAGQSESEIRTHLHREIAVAVRGIQAEIELDAGRIAMLDEQLADVTGRMERLAAMRADYANAVSEVRHFDEILKKAQQDLAAVRASRASADASLLTRLEEPSTGSNPGGPRRAFIVLAGLLGGFATGLGLLFLVPPRRPSESPATRPVDIVPVAPVERETLASILARDTLPRRARSRRNGHVRPADVAIPAEATAHNLSLKQALSRLAND
jgi:polysaccharide biosynthesis transport protein